jgi:hypothetical protein
MQWRPGMDDTRALHPPLCRTIIRNPASASDFNFLHAQPNAYRGNSDSDSISDRRGTCRYRGSRTAIPMLPAPYTQIGSGPQSAPQGQTFPARTCRSTGLILSMSRMPRSLIGHARKLVIDYRSDICRRGSQTTRYPAANAMKYSDFPSMTK